MLPGLNPGSTPAVDSRSVFTRRSGAVVKNATGAVVKKGSGTVVKSSTINPQQPTNPRHWHPPPPLPKLTKEQRESLELKKRTLELKRIAAGVARLPPPNCSNPAPPAPAHKFPVRNPDIQRPPAPTAQPDLGGKNSRAEIKRKKKEAKIRKRFPDLPLEEARLKFSAEKRKAKAARKQEERERSDATHHGPKTRSQQRKRPENRRPPVPAPRRGARNEWKYELVPSQSLRDEITAMVKAKANDPLVEACFTMQPIMPGYSFVPKGNVYITRKAKEYTKEIKKTVYIVHRNLSYPLGIQVPTKIHNKAVEHEKLTKEDRDHTTQLKDIREKREAIACLQGMFGKMPKEERETIVERAFERSSGRVGRTQKICLPERLRRATIAHLRHNHTGYERLLLHNAIKGIGNRGINRHNRIIAEKENARKAVSLKIEAVWEGWEPPVPKPWESLVKSTKEEFLKKVKGYGKQNDGSDSECEEDGFIEDEEDSDEDEDMGDWEEMQRTERPRRNPSASGSDMDQDEDVQYTDFDADTPVPRKRLRNETASPINKRRRVEVERDMKPARRITRSTAGSISYKEPSKSDSDSDLEVLKPPFGRLVVGKGMPTSKKRRMDSNSESENDLYTLPEKAPQPARNEPATVDTQEGACVQADNAPEGYPEYPSVSPGGEDTGAITADESSRPSKRAKTNESHATDVLEPVPSITRTLGDIDLGARDSSPVDPEKDEVMRQIRTQDELRAFVAAQEARHRQESSTIDMITGFGAGFRRQAARMAAGPEVIYISD